MQSPGQSEGNSDFGAHQGKQPLGADDKTSFLLGLSVGPEHEIDNNLFSLIKNKVPLSTPEAELKNQ